MKAEEDQKKERMERWERAVAVYKKNTEPFPSTKPPPTSRKGDTSTSVMSSLPIPEKFPKGDISKENPEKTRPSEEESDPEGRLKRQRTEDISPLMSPAKATAMSGEQQSAEIGMVKVSEMPISGSLEKSTIAGSESMNPLTSKVTPTPSSKQRESRKGIRVCHFRECT